MSIEQDIARIATALEQVASLMKVPPQFILEVDKYATPEPLPPAEFIKPGPGPGRGHKKKKDDVQKMDTTKDELTEKLVDYADKDTPKEVPFGNSADDEERFGVVERFNFIESPPLPPEEPAKPELPEVTLDDVRVALVTMSKTKSRDDVLEICKRFGATSGRDIPPQHYFDALMAFKEGARA